MSCATHLPPRIVGTEVFNGEEVPIAVRELDVLAHCRSGALILNRREEREGPMDIAPAVQEDGCLLHAPSEAGTQQLLCVADDLLPELAAGDAFDLDQQGACDDILDRRARAGDPCRGDTICASVAAEHIYDRADLEGTWGRPGVYAWCGAGRIRIASALLELPCDEFDAQRAMYHCAL